MAYYKLLDRAKCHQFPVLELAGKEGSTWRLPALALAFVSILSTASAEDSAQRTTCTQQWHACTEGVHSRGGNTQQCDSALSACLSTGVWDTCSAAAASPAPGSAERKRDLYANDAPRSPLLVPVCRNG